jgi:hypothetical protein
LAVLAVLALLVEPWSSLSSLPDVEVLMDCFVGLVDATADRASPV